MRPLERIAPAALALAVALAPGGSRAQTCGAPTSSALAPPAATPLRAVRDLLRGPARVAVDPSGASWVADPVAGRVVVRDRYGRVTAVHLGLRSPSAIAVDAAGTAYVAEAAAGRVSVFGAGWVRLGALGRGDGEFVLPADVALDPDPAVGAVYVADAGADAIRVYGTDGAPRSSFGVHGSLPGQLDFPAGVAATALGELFVADQVNRRVQVFDRGGALLRCFPVPGSRLFGAAADGRGRVYLADAFQGRIEVRDELGFPLGAVGSWGEEPGALRTPLGVALDPFGRLLVASGNNGRVEVFGIDAYRDPHVLRAAVDVRADSVGPASAPGFFVVLVELPEAPVAEIDPSSLRANGLPADPGFAPLGDADSDGVPDLEVRFDGAALAATLGGDPAVVAVEGALRDGTPLEGRDTLTLVAVGAR